MHCSMLSHRVTLKNTTITSVLAAPDVLTCTLSGHSETQLRQALVVLRQPTWMVTCVCQGAALVSLECFNGQTMTLAMTTTTAITSKG